MNQTYFDEIRIHIKLFIHFNSKLPTNSVLLDLGHKIKPLACIVWVVLQKTTVGFSGYGS